jgi:hypothetical protein
LTGEWEEFKIPAIVKVGKESTVEWAECTEITCYLTATEVHWNSKEMAGKNTCPANYSIYIVSGKMKIS